MRRLLLYLITLSVVGMGQAKTVVWESPTCIYQTESALKIERVELSDTATVLTFTTCNEEGTWLKLGTSCCLSDEQGNTYAAKGSSGIQLGKSTYLVAEEKRRIQVRFEPLPAGTRFFDILEADNRWGVFFYGIHPSGKSIPVKRMADNPALYEDEISDGQFRKGTAVVRGKFEGYNPDWGFTFLTCYGVPDYCENPTSKGTAYSPTAEVKEDGRFEMEIPMEHPIYTKLELDKGYRTRYIPIYVRSGDTLTIHVEKSPYGNWEIDYASSNPLGACAKLMQHRAVVRLPVPPRTFTQRNWSEYMEQSLKFYQQVMEACDYLAWKYQMSPYEAHLQKTELAFNISLNRFSMVTTKEGMDLQNRVEADESIADLKPDYQRYRQALQTMPAESPTMLFCMNELSSFAGNIGLSVLDSYYVHEQNKDSSQSLYQQCLVLKKELGKVLDLKDTSLLFQFVVQNKIRHYNWLYNTKTAPESQVMSLLTHPFLQKLANIPLH